MTTIRPITLEDAPALAHLLQRVGWWERIDQLSADEAAAAIRRAIAGSLADDSHTLLAALAEGQGEPRLLGYTAVHWLPYLFLPGPEGYISELFVDPEARGQGIGAALLQAVEAEARRRGCFRLSLLNGKQRESYARQFYSKHGWEERPGMANFVKFL